MDKLELVKNIIEEQNKVIQNIKHSVSRYKVASDLDENDSIDPEDFSHQGEAKDMQLRFEQMLIQAKNNLENLKKYSTKESVIIEAGALIETNDFIIFIGISIPQFNFNGKTIITLSEQAPIYKSLKNKKIGDVIKIGALESEIIKIT
jgi:hypothetical protein